MLCPICQNQELKKKSKYCSRDCYARARRMGIYKPFWYGKKRKKETIKKMSTTLKKRYDSGEISIWCKGKKLSEAHKNKLSEAHKKIVGELHPNWQGGIKKDKEGYIRVWIAPKQWRYQHRMVMEKFIKRPLLKTGVVHHKDENKHNNAIDNLILFRNNREHTQLHSTSR